MDSKILDYIILALLFLIAINLLSKMFGINGKESMDGLKQETTEKSQLLQKTEETGPTEVKSNEVNPIEFKLNELELTEPAPVDAVSKPLVEIPTPVVIEIPDLSKKEDDEKGVLKQEFAQVPQNNKEKVQNFTEKEIESYHDSMLDFNETVNKTSSSVDMVDRLNELYTASNNEMAGLKGKTIGQIYDGLTQNILDRKKKCVYEKCLIPPVTDKITKSESYIIETNNGKYYRHGLRYEDDDVMSGGKFYEDVEGSDSEYENSYAF